MVRLRIRTKADGTFGPWSSEPSSRRLLGRREANDWVRTDLPRTTLKRRGSWSSRTTPPLAWASAASLKCGGRFASRSRIRIPRATVPTRSRTRACGTDGRVGSALTARSRLFASRLHCHNRTEGQSATVFGTGSGEERVCRRVGALGTPRRVRRYRASRCGRCAGMREISPIPSRPGVQPLVGDAATAGSAGVGGHNRLPTQTTVSGAARQAYPPRDRPGGCATSRRARSGVPPCRG